jgi:magnesium-transporting ATPase (P-type)
MYKMLAEFPFDSDVKKMSVLYKDIRSDAMYVYTKGAVERVIASCTSYDATGDDDAIEMTEEYREQILQNMEGLAKLGLRVLALASRPYSGSYEEGVEIDRNAIETDLVFRGLIGLYGKYIAATSIIRKSTSANTE